MFSICEMPASPWQPMQSSAFALPAAMSAAWADEPQNIAAANAAPTEAIRICNSLSVVIAGLEPGNPSYNDAFFLMDAWIIPDQVGDRRPGMTSAFHRPFVK
jgi:hypothetical protein